MKKCAFASIFASVNWQVMKRVNASMITIILRISYTGHYVVIAALSDDTPVRGKPPFLF